MSSATSSSSSRNASPDSSATATAPNTRLVRIKNEPIFPDEEPQPLNIEGPGQDGSTSDYVIGTVETLADYLRTLPPSKDKQKIVDLERRIVDLEQQLAMKGIVARSMKESHMRKQVKLEEKAGAERQQLEREIEEAHQQMQEYSEELRGDIEEWKNKFNNEELKCRVLERKAQFTLNQLRQEKCAFEDENEKLRKQLENAQKDKENAKKEVRIATEKARAMEAKVAELEGRVARRNCLLQEAKNDVNKFRKMWKVSDTEKNEALKILEEMCMVDPTIVSTTATSNIPDPSHLPDPDESLENIGTIRFTPFKAPNLEYAGWGGNDVVMGYRMNQQQNIEGTQDREDHNDTSPNGPRRRHSSSSSTTKPSSSRFHPYG